MDGVDFTMPSPKRQRTDSPEAHPPPKMTATEPLLEQNAVPVENETAEQEIENKKDEPVSKEDSGILDALMQHVEAESAHYVIETHLAPTINPTTSDENPNPPLSREMEHKDLPHTLDASTAPATVTRVGPSDSTPAEQSESTVLENEPPATVDDVLEVEHRSPQPIQLTEIERAALEVEGIPPTEAIEPAGEDQPEWEVDSSPYESSSDTDSSDSSSDDSDEDEDDADGDYAMLDPEEAARILMQGDAGSDDEGDRSRNKGEAPTLRTANEVVEDVPPIPEIVIKEDMRIEELGQIEAVVENNVLIKGKVSGEYQVLESGSLLCLQDRTVAGVVAETLGRIEQPLYTVRFRTVQEISDRGMTEKGTMIYYVPQHCSFVFTQPLKAFKGSDASNFHDEEVGDEEMEFSDDEAEIEHKRQLKMKRQGRSAEMGRGRGSNRGGRGGQRGGYKPSPLSTEPNGAAYSNGSIEMNYDDVEDGEEGYTPLVRPNNLHQIQNQSDEPLIPSHMPPPPFSDRGRGRGQNRGRGGRGGRGNFRGNHNNNQSNSSNSRGSPYQQHNNQSPTQYQNPYPNPFQQVQYPYSQPPPAPSLTPQNPSYPYSTITSPMSPLPKTPFNFGAGYPAPQTQSPTFQHQNQQQQQWPQQMPPGFSFNNPQMMQFAQQFQQSQQQYQQQPSNGWQVNQAAAAEVQRQLEEMRRAQGGS